LGEETPSRSLRQGVSPSLSFNYLGQLDRGFTTQDDLLVPAGVDEHRVVLQLGEVLALENADGFGLVGDVVGDDVCPSEGFIEGLDLFDTHLGGGGVGEERVPDKDGEALERLEPFDDQPPDRAGAEDRDGALEVASGAGQALGAGLGRQ